MGTRQAGTDRGERGETGEKTPKGATSSDRSGEKHVKRSGVDSEHGTPSGTGATPPKGAKSSDGGGEKHERINGGVGMGKADAHGRAAGGKERGEMNTGRREGTVYSHNRKSYQ